MFFVIIIIMIIIRLTVSVDNHISVSLRLFCC